MSHIYQRVMLIELLKGSGKPKVKQIAQAVVSKESNKESDNLVRTNQG